MLKILALIIFAGRFIYWIVASKKTQNKKPATDVSWHRKMGKFITFLFEIFIGLQLLNVIHILQIPGNIIVLQLIGFVFLILGTGICIVSRVQLGTNWTHGSEYQIKNGHELITGGLYKYIRHPIYLGYFLSYLGVEMVVGSYLFISFFTFLIALSFQGKREEKILLAHFGNEYRQYQKRTKMLIPFVL